MRRRVTTEATGALRIYLGQSDAEEQWSTGYTQSENDSERDWRKRVTNFQKWIVHERGLTEEAARDAEAKLLRQLRDAGYDCASYGRQTTALNGSFSLFSVKHSGLIYHDWGIANASMSTVWMEMAVQQAETGQAVHREGDGPRSTGDLFRLQVATVCGGLAFELLWKALVQLDDKVARPVHRPGELMVDVCEVVRDRVEATAKAVGWAGLQELHEFLDRHLCNPDVKYNLRTPDGRGGRGFASWAAGLRSMPELSRLHSSVYAVWNVECARRRGRA